MARAYCLDEVLARRGPGKLEEAALSAEISRFDSACAAAAQELDAIVERVQRQVGEKEAAIFQAHRLLLRDPALIGKVKAAILKRHLEAHAALASCTTDPGSYYRHPEVWGDIRAVYTAFLDEHPRSRFDRAWFARWAYACGRYADAHEQFRQLGEDDWWLAFPTKQEYLRIREVGSEAAGNPPRAVPAGVP